VKNDNQRKKEETGVSSSQDKKGKRQTLRNTSKTRRKDQTTDPENPKRGGRQDQKVFRQGKRGGKRTGGANKRGKKTVDQGRELVKK